MLSFMRRSKDRSRPDLTTERARVFALLERGDNFIKYARPGNERRAAERARKRYVKAADLAATNDDEEMARQAAIRLDDLERFIAGAGTGELAAAWDEAAGIETSPPPEHAGVRVPPGQRVTRGWPTLHEGPIPRFDPDTWTFRIFGLVEVPSELSYPELTGGDALDLRSDFHCVTGWSKLDNLWTGVRVRDLIDRARPDPSAMFAIVTADHGYTANLPLEVLMDTDVLLAWGHNGEDLAPKHGYPLRLVVPKLYGWKSVKWVRSIELTQGDSRGYWEVRGYHNEADPWLEQRYSYQE